MALRVHKSLEDLKEFEAKVASGIPPEAVKPSGNQLNLNQNTLVTIIAVLALVLVLKVDFTGPVPQPDKFAGKVLSRYAGPSGSIRLVLDDPYHSRQYKVTLSPEVTVRPNIGEIIQFKGQQLGPDIYIVSADRDLKQLTQMVKYDVLSNLTVKRGRAYFQVGERIESLIISDLPDGHYSQVVIAVDSEYHINVIRATK